ncbi:septum site-determining protein MinC [Thermoflexus sp.]|uniref:septum site-determining protein MinC n=1 Tax=Thermoflexus sp. TaxID=1969742 RepID=UPI0035E414ED
MSREPVAIKGIGDALWFSFGPEPWPEALRALESRLAANSSFFAGGRAVLVLGDRILEEADLLSLLALLNRFGLTLTGVLTDHPVTQALVRRLGLPLQSPPAMERLPEAQELPLESAWVIHRTLRAGHYLQVEGHLCVIGDVHPGAEIAATGDIIVWGRLLGTAHAGCQGDDEAAVYALELRPVQLRIGRYIARSPEEHHSPIPEQAMVQNGRIVVEPWRALSRWEQWLGRLLGRP